MILRAKLKAAIKVVIVQMKMSVTKPSGVMKRCIDSISMMKDFSPVQYGDLMFYLNSSKDGAGVFNRIARLRLFLQETSWKPVVKHELSDSAKVGR